ncbi:MAG: hypothetical protein K8S20_12920 [Chloroflexi bacterium]|nr:hypothetical protein [Chloroflexota bacterium]
MNQKRLELIAALEKARSARVISYITSDRNPFPAQIALDVLPLFNQALESIGTTKKVLIFLYSTGGNLDAPWPLMSLIREYCEEVEVVIPFRALSAATLIALGANRIIMTPLSELSPIDPQGTFVNNDGKAEQYSVEDMASFIDFAKDKIGIAESQPLSEVLRLLSQEIKPTVIGSLNRTYSRIRRLARIMLQSHMRDPKHETQITEIINNLTQSLGSHNHLIHRREARDTLGFGALIEDASPETEKIIKELFESYKEDLELNKPFDPLKILVENETEKDIIIKQAYIESADISHVFESSLHLQLNSQTRQINMQPRAMPAWTTEYIKKEKK